MDGSISNINSSSLADALSAIRLLTFARTFSRSKSIVSTVSLPASIFEKSRMLLMMPSRCCADCCILDEVVLLPQVELSSQG